MIRKEELFKIGRFAKPHGVKGELTLLTDCDVFDEADDPYVVCEIDGIFVPFFIEEYRYKSNAAMLLKLEGVNREPEAREFVNREVYYPLEKVEGEMPVGEVTWENLIGYTVEDTGCGVLGQVSDVDETTANVLLKIDRDGGELLIPAAEEWMLEVDCAGRRLVVKLPDGLLDL